MSQENPVGLNRVALGASLVVNVFLIALIAGRLLAPPPPPQPVPGMPPVALAQPVPLIAPPDAPPPPPFPSQGVMMGPQEGPGGQQGKFPGHRPPPPPFFSASGLFSPEEMRKEFAATAPKFKAVENLRATFAERLRKGPLNKADVLDHFAAIDKIMNQVRQDAQERAATKISGLSAEDRARFADTLARRGPGRDMGPGPGPEMEGPEPPSAP